MARQLSETERAIFCEIAGRLKRLRAGRKWSLEKAAREASKGGHEISKEAVRGAEKGDRMPQTDTLDALAFGYQVSVFDIYPIAFTVSGPEDRARAGYWTLDRRILHDPFSDAPSSRPERVHRARLVSDVVRVAA